MKYEDFGDILDHLYETFTESCENHQNEVEADEFKMKVYFDMRNVTLDIPKIASEMAYKLWMNK